MTTQPRWAVNLDLMLPVRLTCHVTSSLGWSLFFLRAAKGKTQDTVSRQIGQGDSITTSSNVNFKEERSWLSRQSRWLMKTMKKKSQLECLSKTSWSHLHLCRELGRSAGSTSRGEERFGETGGAEGQGSPESGVTFKMWLGQNKHKTMICKSDWRGFLSSPRATLGSDATSECFSRWLSLTHRHVRFL